MGRWPARGLKPGPVAGREENLKVFATLAYACLLSLFYRSLISVIAPELATDLNLDQQQLGWLSALFFIGFAAAQIPVGVLLDRLGPRLTMSGLMGFAVIGIALVCLAPGFRLAALGQVLIGIGCAPVFTGSMMVIGRRYGEDRFGFMVSVLIVFGSLGDLLGTAPLGYLTEAIGWRWSLAGGCLLTILCLLLCFFVLAEEGPVHDQGQQTVGGLLRGMGRILHIRGLWPILPMALTGYAILMVLRGLWAGPFLDGRFGLSPADRGSVLVAMSLAMAAGTFLYGLVDRLWGRRKPSVAVGAGVVALALLGLWGWGGDELWRSALLLGLVGAFAATYPVLMAHCRAFFPSEVMGRGIALMTLVNFGGVGLLQVLSGVWMDRTGDFSGLFLALGLVQLGALGVYLFAAERRSR
ncbi:MAG: MFS transporter [Rhodospirillales bacterium]